MAEDKRNMIVIWMGIVIMISLAFVLSNLSNDSQLKPAFAFFILFIAAMAFIGIVELMEFFKRHIMELWKFWTADIMKSNIIWLGIGIGGVFFTAFIIGPSISNPVITMGISGVIMMYTLLKSKSILVPVITHGLYNTVVLELGKAGLIANSVIQSSIPIPVSNGGLLSDIAWQFGLVANSEEFLKLAVFTWSLFLLRGTFNTKSKIADAIAIILAVVVWILYHSFAGSLYSYFH